jgi:hypothetical protein
LRDEDDLKAKTNRKQGHRWRFSLIPNARRVLAFRLAFIDHSDCSPNIWLSSAVITLLFFTFQKNTPASASALAF